MTASIIRGRVWKYGDNINTDIISPGQYMSLSIEKQSEHAMEAIDPDFSKKMKPGDIIVAGKNFGSGSSRETAPLVLKHLQVGAVISPLFARIFYRNALNIGLPVVEISGTAAIMEEDEIEIDMLEGKISNLSNGTEYQGTKLPEHLIDMISAGGLEAYLAKRMVCPSNKEAL